jgi:hypothetical protein
LKVRIVRVTSPSIHRAKRLIDVLERRAPADHVVEIQAALPIEIEILGHIEMEAIRAHKAALEPLLYEQMPRLEFYLLIRRNCADQRGETARRKAIDTLLEHARIPDRIEGIIDAAVAQPFDLAHRVHRRPIEGIGRPEVFRDLELALTNVHRDDLARAGDPRPLDHRNPHAARAKYRDSRAGRDLRRIQRRPDAGRDRASEQRCPVKRDVVGDLQNGAFVQEHPLGKGAEVGKLIETFALLREARALVAAPLTVRAPGAQMWPSQQALRAVAAIDRRARDNMIARLEPGDLAADRLDDTGRLMAEDRRRLRRQCAMQAMQIAMAHSARHGANQDLARTRLVDLHLFDGERLFECTKNRGFHLCYPRVAALSDFGASLITRVCGRANSAPLATRLSTYPHRTLLRSAGTERKRTLDWTPPLNLAPLSRPVLHGVLQNQRSLQLHEGEHHGG